ncbi:MAG: glycosyltransferase family 2 protein [Peptococcaceae bacterium]|nr:glycosyltransferase family 2 protein [Peptococcaceae bacterium]
MNKAEGLIIIPAYNEENNIFQVIQGIREYSQGLDIIVINDGSEDGTGGIASGMGEQVINHFFNIGYGGALQTGYKYALAREYKYVIQFDADGQHDPRVISTIRECLESGSCDIVIGSRFLEDIRDAGLFKGAAIRFFRLLIKFFTGERITDPTSGLQGLNREVFEHFSKMGMFPEDYPDADTLIYAIKKGYRVLEVPAKNIKRLSGKSMHKGIKCVYYVLKMIVSILVVVLRLKFEKKVMRYV